jgi:hypothetical protein
MSRKASPFLVGLITTVALLSACEFPVIVTVEATAEEPTPGVLFPLSGDYHLIMRTGLGDLRFATTADFTVEAPAIAFTLQALSAIECTGSRAPIGELYAIEAPVDGGLFTLGPSAMTLPGASSDFSCDEPQLIGDVTLVGALRSQDVLYGVFEAHLNEPEDMTLSGPFTVGRPAALSDLP